MNWVFLTLINVISNGTAMFLYKVALKKIPIKVSSLCMPRFYSILMYTPVFIFSLLRSPLLFSALGYFLFLISLFGNAIAIYLYIQA